MKASRTQKLLASLITIAVAGGFGMVIWYLIGLTPANRQAAGPVSFRISQGQSAPDIAAGLSKAGIIRSQTVFLWYVTLRGLRADLQAGNYDLSPASSVPDIANILSHGKVSVNRLVVPEGVTVAQIKKLAAAKGISNQDFDAAIAGPFDNDILGSRPPGDTSLEGYLFPDSYELTKPVRPQALIRDMLNNFKAKANQAGLVKAFSSQGLTLHQGLTLASIVEKEAAKDSDRSLIASVFYNRLKIGMPLGSDVTVLYAAEAKGVPFDVNLNSAYNTYRVKGLPPGPICNPGISSMKAVAEPAATDYLYFLADKNGTVHYARTAAEHEANVQKYLR